MVYLLCSQVYGYPLLLIFNLFSSYVYVYYIIPFIFPTVPVGIVYIYHST